MNGNVIRQSGKTETTLILDQNSREKIGCLGKAAETFVNQEDPRIWTATHNPDYLKYVRSGAMVLQRIGTVGADRFTIEDAGAHLAFMALDFLTLFVPRLGLADLIALKGALRMMSLCCSVEIERVAMPAFDTLPKKYQESPMIRRVFARYQEALEKNDGPELTLADALALLRIIEVASEPSQKKLVAKLKTLTEGLRSALRRLREVPT